MHLFIAASGPRPPAPQALDAALSRATARLPALADAESWSVSGEGVVAAGRHHAGARVAPRVYRHVGDDECITFYDGFPLLPARGWDAARLAARWDALPAELEGAAVVARVRPDAGEAEVVTAPMGMLPLYAAEFGGGRVVSTSLLALRTLLDRHELDEAAAAGFLCLGWPLGERTLVRGIEVLPGGSRIRLSRDGLEVDTFFGPETVPRMIGTGTPAIAPLAEQLVVMARAPAEAGLPVQSPITAGRDSRLVMALLRAAGVEAEYYTGGHPGEPDVEIARDLAARLGVRHVTGIAAIEALPAQAMIGSFVDLNDGMASLESLRDHVRQLDVPERVGIVGSGMGGEMVRGGSSLLVAFTGNAWPLAHLPAFQHRMLQLKVRDGGAIVRPEAVASAREQLRASLDGFAAMGWPAHTLNEAFYAFERIGKWGTASTRRTAATADLLSPLTTRPVLDHGMAGTPGERFVESTHRDLLAHLDPVLHDAPLEFPWHRRLPRLAPVTVSALAARLALGRVRSRLRPAPPQARHVHMTDVAWRSLRPAYAAALADTADQHPVFRVVDRAALWRAVTADTPPDNTVHRAVTLLWALDQRR